jgi:16S rRNA C967 or C1407 C5-methylase (RsmB/RsmF family)/NOL1/NOP2/fmu family ribosome biogenesis protein
LTLPAAYRDRTRALLGTEADAFLAVYDRSAVAGLRVNPAKITLDELRRRTGWRLDPVPWCPGGAYLDADHAERPGAHPYHAAGLYYLQEPSAMAVAEAMRVTPGQRVLDVAAAPGGKSTHLAGLLDGRGVVGHGLLVANEIHPARIKALGENLERWGAPNVVITNADPDRLGGAFDRVLLDAPCSGEGMFRRDPAAVAEWSPERVLGSAGRQLRILRSVAPRVAPGGLLLYSTCTFNREENERVVAAFLAEHPGWSLVDIPKPGGIAPGLPLDTPGPSSQAPELTPVAERFTAPSHGRHPEQGTDPNRSPTTRMARLWPHRLAGEGHTLALLRAPGDEPEPDEAVGQRPGVATELSASAAWRSLAGTTLATDPSERWGGSLRLDGDRLMLTPPGTDDLDLGQARVVRRGLWLATVKPGRVEPSHALALALRADDAANRLDLTVAEAGAYLAGHPVSAVGAPGWVLVTVDGFPLGWGKRSGSIVKNHYPKGLRRPTG